MKRYDWGMWTMLEAPEGKYALFSEVDSMLDESHQAHSEKQAEIDGLKVENARLRAALAAIDSETLEAPARFHARKIARAAIQSAHHERDFARAQVEKLTTESMEQGELYQDIGRELHKACAEVDALKAEVERLKRARDDEELHGTSKDLGYGAEIEALKIELAQAREERDEVLGLLDKDPEYERVWQDREKIIAENARLRKALHNISLASQNSMSSKEDCGREAREALEKK